MTMSSAVDFTEAEVVEELRDLGYDNIPREKLVEFMTDLKHLMAQHDEKSRGDSDFSFASTVADSSSHSDGLARYPHQTDFHWGQPRRVSDDVDVVSATSSPRSAFEKSKVPLRDNSFYNESFVRDESGRSQRGGDDQGETSPKRLIQGQRTDDSIVSSTSSTNSIVVKRKISRRDSNGNRDISTEELTYVEENNDDDDAATLVDGEAGDAILDEDDDDDVNDLSDVALSRRIVGRRPRSAESHSSIESGSSSIVRPMTGLPSFIRPQPEPRRRRHDPVNRYHQYNEAWSAQRAPGEKQHKQLRWAVREQMQRREEIITPMQRYYVPNDFVPPTDKRRQNLRWEIRTKLAHKLNPSKNSASFNIWT